MQTAPLRRSCAIVLDIGALGDAVGRGVWSPILYDTVKEVGCIIDDSAEVIIIIADLEDTM